MLGLGLPLAAQLHLRPPPKDGLQGPPLFLAFRSPDFKERLSESLAYLSPSVRAEVERSLAARAAYEPVLPRGDGPKLPMLGLEGAIIVNRRRDLEAAIVTLLDRPDLQREAVDFARAAKLFYEWEGQPEGPMTEADFAENDMRAHPGTALAPFLKLLELNHYRCAFEAAIFTKSDRQKNLAADGYRRAWRRVPDASDPVVKAVAEDIDVQAYVYMKTSEHPRVSAGR